MVDAGDGDEDYVECAMCAEEADGTLTCSAGMDVPVCESCLEQILDWRMELLEDVVPPGEEWRVAAEFGVA